MKKKVLFITTIIVLTIATIGTWAYFYYLQPDPQIAQQLEKQFGDKFFNFAPDNQTTSGVKTNQADDSITSSTLKKITQTTEKQNLPAEDKRTEQAIIEKYVPRFDALEQASFSRLDTLMASAVQEYRQQKAAGTLNTAALAKKYLQAGNMLQNNIDSAFNNTLSDMKNELEQNNLPTTVIEEIKNQYDSAKATKRSELLAKARK